MKIFRQPKKFAYFKTNSRGGLLKFQASSFNIFIPPSLVILNELSLIEPSCQATIAFVVFHFPAM